MNKLAIPAILVATVMVAGLFAFSPINEASTVHTTVTANVANQDFVLDCAVSTMVLDSVTAVIICSAVKADGGLVDFDTLTVTVIEQADFNGDITADPAIEIDATDRFSIDLDDTGAGLDLNSLWCGTVSVTDGTSTAESNVCTEAGLGLLLV